MQAELQVTTILRDVCAIIQAGNTESNVIAVLIGTAVHHKG